MQPGPPFVPTTTLHQGNIPVGNTPTSFTPVIKHVATVHKAGNRVMPGTDASLQGVTQPASLAQGSPVRMPWSQVVVNDSANTYGVDQLFQH